MGSDPMPVRRTRFGLAMTGCLLGVGLPLLALFGLSAAQALIWGRPIRDPWLLSAGLASLTAAGFLLFDMAKRCQPALDPDDARRLTRWFSTALATAAGATVVTTVAVGPLPPGIPAWSGLRLAVLLLGFACLPLIWLLGDTVARHLESFKVWLPTAATRNANTTTVAEKCAISAIVVSFGMAVAWVISIDTTFFWDESVYAVMSRGWLKGTPITGVALHRAPALPLAGMIAAAFTESEAAFRLIGLFFALAGILVIWKLGRTVGGPLAGLLAAAALASGGPAQLAAASFLTDVPAAVLLLTVTLVLWVELQESTRPSSRLLTAAPLLVSAYYFRYGSALPAMLLLLTAGIMWRRTLWEHRRLIGGLVGIGMLLLVPHLVHSIREVGSPWGIVAFTGEVAGREFPGEGILFYVRSFPTVLLGWFGGVLAAVGLGAAAGALISGILARALEPITRFHLFAGGVALGVIVIIGWFAHGETRFVFYPMWLLALSGATLISTSVSKLPRFVRSAAMMALFGITTAAFMLATKGSLRERDREARKFRVVATAAQAIKADVNGPCSVLTSLQAQVNWYSSCSTHLLNKNSGREIGRSYDYLLLFDRYDMQVGPMFRMLAAVDPDPMAVVEDGHGIFGSAVIYRSRH